MIRDINTAVVIIIITVIIIIITPYVFAGYDVPLLCPHYFIFIL